MLLLNREDILSVFTMKEAIEADKLAFKMVVENSCEIPLRTKIQAPKYDGCLLFMPAYAAGMDAASLKVINIFPKNANSGLPTSFAQVLLVDGATGRIEAILDGDCVTALRTGAASGAAFDLLGVKDAKLGALFGVGGQAPAQLEAMLAARQLEEVRVYSRNAGRTAAFAARMNEQLAGYGARIVAAASPDEAIDSADLIATATPSSTPVFDGTKLKKGATVSCVGAYQHHMQELDPEALRRASKLYFDSQSAVLSESGDILIPLEQGIITEADFTGELGEVVLGLKPGRENDEEIIIFESVGVAVQDLVTARAIFDKALTQGIGTQW